MRRAGIILMVALGLLAFEVKAQLNPNIGYLFPAGGKQGTSFEVLVGGQALQKPEKIYISGTGVRGSVVRYTGRIRYLNKEQNYLLCDELLKAWMLRLKEVHVKPEEIEKLEAKVRKRWPWKILANKELELEGEKLPEHPLLMDIQSRTARELMHIKHYFYFPRLKMQDNRQLEEYTVIKITIDKTAAPGDRELRIKTARGMTKPVVFQVGTIPEVFEREPNDYEALAVPDWIKGQQTDFLTRPLKLPVMLNGQVMPGDIDRFRFAAKKGQKLVIEAEARRLIPYLADAVPGWFQAVIRLYDSEGKEVAYADDYMMNPDPFIHYEVPADGEYEIAIHDSIFRGRYDFVYRISVDEKSRLASKRPVFKGCGDAWSARAIFPVGLDAKKVFSTKTKDLRVCKDKEPNNTTKKATKIVLGALINGKINKPGDIDVFRFTGEKGAKVVAELYGRRLASPIDSVLKLMDKKGNVIAWNDDHMVKDGHLHLDDFGIMTHHADSYLLFELPKKGEYYIQLSDAQKQGSDHHGYKLRVSEARPGFTLRVTPSSIYTRPGDNVPVTAYAIRTDGFDGKIEIKLKNAPTGSKLSGATILPGHSSVRMTIRLPKEGSKEIAKLEFEGSATIGDKVITGIAEPADNVMQAFLWRHLVPSLSTMIFVKKQKWALPEIKILNEMPIEIPVGGKVTVRFNTRHDKYYKDSYIAFDDPPAGILADKEIRKLDGGSWNEGWTYEFDVKASSQTEAGFNGNLIASGFKYSRDKDGELKKKQKPWLSITLPAIPVAITASSSSETVASTSSLKQ